MEVRRNIEKEEKYVKKKKREGKRERRDRIDDRQKHT